MTSKQAQWAGRVAQWRSSGLSQAAWCREAGLSLSSFGYWQRKLSRPSTPGGLLPIRVSSAPEGLQVRFPNGIVVGMPVPADAAGLHGLLRALGGC